MAELTVAQVETEACLIVGRLMDLVGLHGAGSLHPNPSLNAPIRDGLRRMGYPVADPITVADPDVASLDNLALRRLLEWVELRVLEQVERDWWRAESPRRHGLEIVVVGGVVRDPLASVKNRIGSRLGELRSIVNLPYQSMNTPIALDRIARGSTADPTVPAAIEQQFPAFLLANRPWWYYGTTPGAYWGWGEWSW